MQKFAWMIGSFVLVVSLTVGCGGDKDKKTDDKKTDDKKTDDKKTAKTANQKDMDKFQGNWVVVGMETEGQDHPAEKFKKVKSTMAFNGDKISTKFGSNNDEGTFFIDASKTPKTITMTLPGQKDVKGIYEFTDDTLRICGTIEGDAPKEFKTEKTKAKLMTLHREKK